MTHELAAQRDTLHGRVQAVRDALRQVEPNSETPATYAQWPNWPNWGNWGNWGNWPNWNNWNNWFNR